MLAAVRNFRVCALLLSSTIAPFAAMGSTVTPIYTISGFNDGALPDTTLTEFGGKYYGTTYYGGPGPVQADYQTGQGVLYSVDPRNGAYAVVYRFSGKADGSNPASRLIAFQGKLYGTTLYGGANEAGVVFSYDPVTQTENVVYSLPAATSGGSALTPYEGRLYGTGSSSIFSVDPASGTGRTDYQFPASGSEGSYPGNLTLHDGHLYGTTNLDGPSGGGTLFRFDPRTDELVVEHAFGAKKDGREPNADLVEVGGILYGTTEFGGKADVGTIFNWDSGAHKEAVLYSFSRASGVVPSSGLLVYNGLLYGRTEDGLKFNNGGIFAFDPASSTLSEVHVATGVEGPYGGPTLNLVGGQLWGVLNNHGAAGRGAVFSVDPTTGGFTTLHDFAGSQQSGASGLVKLGGTLFGTAVGGGAHGLGSIYKVEPGLGTGATLYSFQGTDGARPEAPLLAAGSTLYGTTSLGGVADEGTLFSFELQGRRMTILTTFQGGAMGGRPVGQLAMLGGAIYGSTTQGGKNSSGTIFKFDPATAQITTVANFPFTFYPSSTGLTAAGGLLYGTTTQEGVSRLGTIYSFDPSTRQLTTLISFAGGEDGGNPTGPLLYSNGMLYGATSGERGELATVFSFDPATNTKTILHQLHGQLHIQCALAERGSKLYGTFPSAGKLNAPLGGFFRTDVSTGYSHVTTLQAGAVTNPASSLTQSNGALFGTTLTSTTDNAGTVFKYLP